MAMLAPDRFQGQPDTAIAAPNGSHENVMHEPAAKVNCMKPLVFLMLDII